MKDKISEKTPSINVIDEMKIKDVIAVNEWFSKMMLEYRCAMMEIETKFNVLNEEFKLKFDRNPISSIKTRLKDPISLYMKTLRRGVSFSETDVKDFITDIAGIRVICPFLEDVYMLSDALLKQDDITLITKKDYIENPKENGYRSLHLIVSVPIFLENEKKHVKAEIQFRTIAMDFWASLEHQLRYKKGNSLTEEDGKELLDCAEKSAELDRKMDALKKRIIT